MPKTTQKSILIFLILIVLLICIAIFLIVRSIPNNLTEKIYTKIVQDENYTFTIEGKEEEYSYKTILSQRDEDISIDTYTKYDTEDIHNTILVKDGSLYTISHDDQEYMSLDGTDIDLNSLVPEKKDIDEKSFIKGREEINGTTYYYEEFENIITFLMLIEAHEDAKIKTRFYYNNRKELVYIKNIVEDENEIFEEFMSAKFTQEVDNSVFDIPVEYAESQDEEF